MRSQYFFHSAVVVSVLVAACSPETTDDSTTGGTGGIGGATGGTSAVGGTAGTPPVTGGVGGGVTGGAGGVTGGTAGVGGVGGAGAMGGTPTGGSAGAGAGAAGTGGVTVGGAAGSGGDGPGGAGAGGAGAGGDAPGGAGAGGATAGAGGSAGAGAGAGGGSGGGTANAMGPCDIYAAGMPAAPCVGAYSTIRRLRAAYTGPLFQVRSGSNAMNTGSGGTTVDIAQTDGFALRSTVDAACGAGICTVSLLYDQSGRGNHLPVAKRGRSDGGMYAAMDDFETTINVTAAQENVGGRQVYSLYMAARQGYRQTVAGAGVPLHQESQGLYMLADGTHAGTACCWDFGNVSPDPTRYGIMNTLFLGVAFWGRGAGSGPWYMADYEAGVWAGGTNPGDPGWGAIGAANPPNPANPSIRVKYALGYLKTNTNNWSLRMADAATASSITTAYAGGLPKRMENEGAIVLGVGGDNSNNSWGTFYEGAVLAGFPSDATELAVMQNIKALGYGQ